MGGGPYLRSRRNTDHRGRRRSADCARHAGCRSSHSTPFGQRLGRHHRKRTSIERLRLRQRRRNLLRLQVGRFTKPRRWPDKLHADKGYDFARCRQHLRRRSIKDRIARRGIERNDRLGRHRWVVERTHAWLAAFGKLRVRFERSIHTHSALLSLACSVICMRSLMQLC